ncbi:MAG: DUF5682 family protein [Bacteroidia bacterium]
MPAHFIDLSPLAYWPDDLPAETQAPAPDPLECIAQTAGYRDGESWWDHVLERRDDAGDPFDALTALMGELREMPDIASGTDLRTLRREAQMRRHIAAACARYDRVAVVCGAFHAPAIAGGQALPGDKALLRGMKLLKGVATWVPWSYPRLSMHSGYGAGIHSPQWYETLFDLAPGQRATHWIAQVAALLRQAGLEASPAQVIDAIQLCQALCVLRSLDTPGLAELSDAVEGVFSQGQDTALRLIGRHLITGDKIGQVPATIGSLPLRSDIARQQRSLRLPLKPEKTTVELDLRKEAHLAKSVFLHRTDLLGISWAALRRDSNKLGTFREVWELCWEPEHELQIIEASVWGHTLDQAVLRKQRQHLEQETQLPRLAQALDRVLPADLPTLVPLIAEKLEVAAALDTDLGRLLETTPTLIRLLRYGDIRQSPRALVAGVLAALLPRIWPGLLPACRSINDEVALQRYGQVLAFQSSLRLLAPLPEAELLSGADELRQAWQAALARLAADDAVHPRLAGMAVRLLVDEAVWDTGQASLWMHRTLSPGTPAPAAAAWIAGFLQESGLMLLHHPRLWELLDHWIADMAPQTFQEALPLLRRIFANFSAAERWQLGELLGGKTRTPYDTTARPLHQERAAGVLPVLRTLLES